MYVCGVFWLTFFQLVRNVFIYVDADYAAARRRRRRGRRQHPQHIKTRCLQVVLQDTCMVTEIRPAQLTATGCANICV